MLRRARHVLARVSTFGLSDLVIITICFRDRGRFDLSHLSRCGFALGTAATLDSSNRCVEEACFRFDRWPRRQCDDMPADGSAIDSSLGGGSASLTAAACEHASDYEVEED